jgi:xylose isomerase
MKKVMIVVAVLTMVAFAFGAMAVAKVKTTPAPKVEKFSGAIATIDAMAKTFDVKKKMKKEEKVMTFAIDEKTKITKGKEVKSFADLKEGMEVFVQYKVEMGKNMASAIKISTPKAAPKPKGK